MLISALPLLLALSPAAPTLQGEPSPAFAEVTASCGVGDSPGGKLAFGDYDGDGDPDLLVAGARLWRNDAAAGEIRLTEVTAEASLKPGGDGAAWCDLDRDGDLDIVTNAGTVWLQGERGRFALEPALAFTVPGGHAAAIGLGDLEGDGWLDVMVGGGEQDGRSQPQSLWRNDRGKRFVDVTDDELFHEPRYGRAVVWCDYDGDGDSDVYSGNYRLQPNALYRNDDGTLVEVDAGVTGVLDPTMFTHEVDGRPQQFGFHYGHTIAASWADLDGDGWFDLWASNLVHKYVGEVSDEFAKLIGSKVDFRGYYCDDSNLFINQGPPSFHFEDERVARGIPTLPIGGHGVYRGDELWSNSACGDCDNDGWIDVWTNQVYGHLDYSMGHLYCNRAGEFTELHSKAGIAMWGGYGGAWADLDSDGRLDLAVSGRPEAGEGGLKLHVFANRCGEENDWIGFRLVDGETARPVGAVVTLETESHVQVRQVETTMGSHTQANDSRVHFGLGDEWIERVWVRWPDGTLQLLEEPAPGTYHVVEKASGRAPQLKRMTPGEAHVGEEVGLSLSGGRGERYFWDLGGSRRAEAITEEGKLRWSFEEEGPQQVRVKVVNRKGVGTESVFTIEVAGEE